MQWCTEKHQLSEKQSSWGELECWLRQGICRNQEGSHNQSVTWICWFFPSFHIRNWCKLTGIRCCSYAGSRYGRRIIAYASRTFHWSERNDAKYSSAKLGLLAVKWVVTEKFKDNLYGAKFEILTDNNPPVLPSKYIKTGYSGTEMGCSTSYLQLWNQVQNRKNQPSCRRTVKITQTRNRDSSEGFYDHVRRSYADFKWTQQHDCGL